MKNAKTQKCKICGSLANAAHLAGRAHKAAIKTAEMEKMGYTRLAAEPFSRKPLILTAETGSVSGGKYKAGRMVSEIWMSPTLTKLVQQEIAAGIAREKYRLRLAEEAKKATATATVVPVSTTRAAWIAAGRFHPAPAEILAEKQASGLTWSQYESIGQ